MTELGIERFYGQPNDIALLQNFARQEPDLFKAQQVFVSLYGDVYESMPPRFAQHDRIAHYNSSTGDLLQHRQGLFFAPDVFMRLLGPDTAHELHSITQASVALQYGLRPELIVMGIVHDWGEAHPGVGDGVFGGGKSDKAKNLEVEFRTNAIHTVFGDYAQDVLELSELIDDLETDLGREFKLAERIGYMATILRAASLAINPDITPCLVEGDLAPYRRKVLWSIASHALFHLAHMRNARERIEGVDVMLATNDDTIIEIERKFKAPTSIVLANLYR